MEHSREPLLHLFKDLAAIFGRTGAETVIALLSVVVLVAMCLFVLWTYLILGFGESTFREALRFLLEGFKVFRYQPSQKTHQSIRLELYFDALLALVLLVSLVGLVAHALVPWIPEHAENLLFAVFVSALVIFAFLARVSINMAARFPHP